MKYIESLHWYEYHGRETGGFLRAVLENDFMAAVGHADDDSLKILKPLAQYVFMELASNCYGTKVLVDEWLKHFRLESLGISEHTSIFHELDASHTGSESYACDICMKPIIEQTFVKIRRVHGPDLSIHKACAPSGAIKREEKM